MPANPWRKAQARFKTVLATENRLPGAARRKHCQDLSGPLK